MKLFGFPRSRRMTHKGSYRLVQREGKKVVTRYFVFLLRPNGLKWPRLGLIVSKKAGNAVVRNRIKRVARSVFRQCTPFSGYGLDVVVIPRRSLPVPVPFDIVAADFAEMEQTALERFGPLEGS